MQVITARDTLLAALDKVAAVVQGKSELKGLSFTYIKPIDSSSFMLQALNHTATISTVVTECSVTDPTPVAIQSHVLRDIVKYAPEEKIKITVRDNKAHIQSGRSRFQLPVDLQSEIPVHGKSEFDESTETTVFLENITEILSSVSYCMSKDSQSPYENGMMVIGDHAYSTNKTQMACHQQEVFKPLADCLIPTEFLETIPKIFKQKGENITVMFSDKRILLQDKSTQYVGTLSAAAFPDVAGVFSRETPTNEITLERSEFQMALRRVCLVTDKDKKLEIRFEESSCFMECGTDISKSDDTVSCTNEGPTMKLALNAALLSSTVDAIKDNVLSVTLNGDMRPIILRGERCAHVLMPMRF